VEGTAQVLLETGIQFDIVDERADLSRYQTVFLPDNAYLTPPWVTNLETYLAGGGKLVVSGAGGLDPVTGQFQLKEIPVTYLGKVPTRPAYLRLDPNLAKEGDLATDYDYVFYDQAYLVRPVEGAQAFGELKRALFNRTWEHFTSHQHAPVGDSLNAPIAVRMGRVLYFAAPLFNAYRSWDYWAYRAVAVSALRDFLPPALLKPRAPGWVEMTLHTQPQSPEHPPRKIVHVVTYHPRRSLQTIQHVDQCYPTSGLGVSVRLDGMLPKRVYLAPQGEPLEFEVKGDPLSSEGDYVEINLPPVGAHSVVVIE
jgi:Beta-galactosidase trimerisation domain